MDHDSDISFEKNVSEELEIQEFLNVGIDHLAYIREVQAEEGQPHNDFIVYGADGSQLSIMDSYDTALVAARLNDLHPVTVH
jgi:hypothetical protein